MKRFSRAVALAAAAGLCLAVMPGLASAQAKNAKGSPAWCRNHAKSKLAACVGTAGAGGGTGGTPPAITVTVSPDLVETGQSEIDAVVEVETSPSYAGDSVDIDSSPLAASCGGAILFGSLQASAAYSAQSVQVVLDDDGNVTVRVYGIDCAPGQSTIEADLTVAPYLTALGTVDAQPPAVTPAGVFGFPANEVETGNSPASGDSDVYAVFYVETDPVYAEQTVEIDSPQLVGRCLGGSTWISNQGSFGNPAVSPTATATLDDDGNAVLAFSGSSCAAGASDVIADVLAGSHSTYTTTFTIVAPTPTI